jgi:hypothetical protein
VPLPNFLIIGAAKAGTTSLWKYCDEHPQVFMSRVKECNFFSRGDPDIETPGRPARFAVGTLDEYRRLFDGVRDEVAIGEASPEYLRSPQAPGRIDGLLPGVRIVVSLREPAARVYSSYQMQVRQGRESAGVDEALAPGSRRIRYGMYFESLKRYYDVFGRARIHVCLFDDLNRDAAALMAALFRFLGVDDTFRPDVETKHNVGALSKAGGVSRCLVAAVSSRGLGQYLPRWAERLGRRLLLRPAPGCPPELHERLRRLYRDDILKVQDLIQRDLSGWLA